MPKFRIVQIYEKYIDAEDYDHAHDWVEYADLSEYNHEVLVENISQSGDNEC